MMTLDTINVVQITGVVAMSVPFCYVFFWLAKWFLDWLGRFRAIIQTYCTFAPMYYMFEIYKETLVPFLKPIGAFDSIYNADVRDFSFYAHLSVWYLGVFLVNYFLFFFYKNFVKIKVETEEEKQERLYLEDRADKGLPVKVNKFDNKKRL